MLRLSTLFAPTRKDTPHEETSTNAQLLLRAGYIDKLMAGVYTLLPLGLLVYRRVENIIRAAMNELGASELRLPSLHPRSVWDATNRWTELAPIMYQFRDHGDREVGLGTTHEDVLTAIIRTAVNSYRDLPLALYQIQTKYRDEPRPKSGLIRLREFTMKDLYSFHRDEAELDTFYDRVRDAYHAIFRACGLDALMIEASGGSFSQRHSDEFQVLTPAGEDRVLYCPSCRQAQNHEVATLTVGDRCPKGDGVIVEAKGVEVGNIFKLGTRFSDALGAHFVTDGGQRKSILMASYGIGLERLVGTIAEIHHDEHGLAWPVSVAPALATILGFGPDGQRRAQEFALTAERHGQPVLLADVDRRPGELLALTDLLGLPIRIVFSSTTGDGCEWREQRGQPERRSIAAALDQLRALR